MNTKNMGFSPGNNTYPDFPLSRYLQPVPREMITNWLQRSTQENGWLLDPFGSTPQFPLEAAKMGKSVFVVCNNPIISFMIKILASDIQRSDFAHALAFLSKEKILDTRLEPHLKSLYETVCDVCGEKTQCISYQWNLESDQNFPVSKHYECPHCNNKGDFAITPFDKNILSSIQTDTLHRSRAVQRVVPESDIAYKNTSTAVNTYYPRPLYFLSTLTNRILRSSFPKNKRRLLTALLITVFDKGNTLWPQNSSRSRPRSITQPTHFIEHNLWKEMESSISEWVENSFPVPISIWPELPDKTTGSICLYEGRLPDLTPIRNKVRFSKIATILPRPNQAFWTYSAIWSGWLWGTQTVRSLYSALLRQRYDWNWLTSAYFAIFSNLKKQLGNEADVLALMAEAEPGFITAFIAATRCAGYKLQNISFRQENEILQTSWKTFQYFQAPLDNDLTTQLVNNLKEFIENSNQSLDFTNLFLNTLKFYEHRSETLTQSQQQPDIYYKNFFELFNKISNNDDLWDRFEKQEKNSESGYWFPKNCQFSPTHRTTFDQIENEIIEMFTKKKLIEFPEIDQHICTKYSEPIAPPTELIKLCLDSYAKENIEDSWETKTSENGTHWEEKTQSVKHALEEIGKKLVYSTAGTENLIWKDSKGNIRGIFHIQITANTANCYSSYADNNFLVLPDERLDILLYKMKKAPFLKNHFNKKWSILTFNTIISFSNKAILTISDWDMISHEESNDPNPQQISIF